MSPGLQRGEDLFRILEEVLLTDPPGGVKVGVKLLSSGGSWLYTPKGPAFEGVQP